MRKSIGLLSLVMFIFATLFAGSAYAQLTISWFQVQKRTYENGDQFDRVQFAVNDHSLVVGVRLYEDGVLIPDVDKNDFTFFYDTSYRAFYDASDHINIWDWSNVGTSWIVDEVYYWNSDFTLLDGALYRIEVDWAEEGGASGTAEMSKLFTEVIDLPIVSSLDKTNNKNKDQELKVEFLDDGSMVVRWDAPTVNYGGTRQVVYLSIPAKSVYIYQPTHVGMLIVPPSVIAVLQADPDYDGFFNFLVQLRTYDNCNRTYSNWSRYYFE